jgi:hypothetical protein
MDDPQLRKVLREWKVEDAPRCLDGRVLGVRKPWWRFLITGSMRVPVPVALVFAAVFVMMGVALTRPRSVPVTPAAPPGDSSTVDLAGFRPVQSVQIRIIGGRHALP